MRGRRLGTVHFQTADGVKPWRPLFCAARRKPGREATLPPRGDVVRWCIHGVPSSYLSRTCLVPVSYLPCGSRSTWEVRDRYETGTRQVRDRYTVDTPWKLAGSMGEVSACGPSRAHASGQQVCWKPLGFKALALPQPCGTARPLLVHGLRCRRQPDFRFRKSAKVWAGPQAMDMQPARRATALRQR